MNPTHDDTNDDTDRTATRRPDDMGLLGDLERTTQRIAAQVGAATVTIGRDGRGCGVVIGPGRVLTNAHNLRDRTTQVTFADDRFVQGRVLGSDPHHDLVVLEADTGDIGAPDWADRPPAVGTVVFGLSRGPRGVRIGFGLVSGLQQAFTGPRGRRILGAIEHNAPMARGSSGGPLVDRHGRLLGLNTHRLAAGHYLAIPADETLRRRTESMSAGEDVPRATLGVALASAEVARRLRAAVGLEDREGLLVRAVESGSPADRAGVREGDLLVAAGGRTLARLESLYELLDGWDPSAPLDLEIVRGVDELSVVVDFTGDDV